MGKVGGQQVAGDPR